MVTERQVRDVIARVRENFDANALGKHVDFDEAGLDSLDQASILLSLQEETGIEFPEDASSLNTIDAILNYASAQQTPPGHDRG